MEGEFEKRDRTFTVRKVEQAVMRKHVDNLKMEGNMYFTNKNTESDQKVSDIEYGRNKTENNETVSTRQINRVTNIRSKSENISSVQDHRQNVTNNKTHAESQITLGLVAANDANKNEKISVTYGQSRFEGELRQSADAQNVETRVSKQTSAESSSQRSLKTEEHAGRIERKTWETIQKRDYSNGSVSDVNSVVHLSKPRQNQIDEQKYSHNTTTVGQRSSSQQRHHQLSDQQHSTQSSHSAGSWSNERRETSLNEQRAHTARHSNEQSTERTEREYTSRNAGSRDYCSSGQISSDRQTAESGQYFSSSGRTGSAVTSAVTGGGGGDRQVRRPESFEIKLSTTTSDHRRRTTADDQIRRDHSSGSSSLSTNNHRVVRAEQSPWSPQKQSSEQQSSTTIDRSARDEVKSYSTATYRKSVHSTSSNVLNVDGSATTTATADGQPRQSVSHHRRSVISSSTDVGNSVFYRKGDVTHVEAPHITSLAAAAQRKSINTLDSPFIVSAQDHRNTLSAMHRQERTVARTSTAGSSSNRSHISLGGDYTSSGTSHYRHEYKPRVTGPCPVPLIESNQAPFRHTRDTKTHKFYKATTGSPPDRK